MSNTVISSILSKNYQNRKEKQHQLLVSALKCYFSDFSTQKIKLLTFFIQKIQGPYKINAKQFSPFSFILNPFVYDSKNKEIFRSYQILSNNKQILVQQGNMAAVIDYKDYMGCQALGDTSIEQELSSFGTSQYFCTIPKKICLQILRNCVIQNYKQKQTVYIQNQDIAPRQAGSGVYIVRKGQFAYFKHFPKQNKQIQVFRFGKGNIFGTIDIQRQSQDGKYPKRLFTVSCKTINSIVYKITKQIFVQKIKPYCDSLLMKKQIKLIKFITPQSKNQKLYKSKELVQVKSPFGSTSARLTKGFYSTRQYSYKNKDPLQGTQISLKRNDSQPLGKLKMMNTTQKMYPYDNVINGKQPTHTFYSKGSLPGLVLNKTRYSEVLAQDSTKKINYLSLKKQGPLKKFPMTGRRSSFMDSQFTYLQHTKDPEMKKPQPIKLQRSVQKQDFIFRILMKNQAILSYKSKKFQKKAYI